MSHMNVVYARASPSKWDQVLSWIGPITPSFPRAVVPPLRIRVAFLASGPFSLIRSADRPNKANPDAMELLRGQCNEILAAHGQAVLLLKGLPSGYNRDLQCIKPIVHNVVDRLRQMCELATAFVTRLDFDADRLRASLAHGSIEATLRMERLVKKGSSLRDAHHDVAHELQQEGGDAVVPALANSGRYHTIGGANPAETRRVAELLLKELRIDP